MTTEQAILSLSRRAEYAQAKADTPDKQRKAAEYVEAVNRIIDFYNRTEAAEDERQNLQDIVQVLCEYIGIRQADIDTLKQTNAKYIRKRLLHWLPDWSEHPHWLFHHVALDSEMLQYKIAALHDYQSIYLPLIQSVIDKHTRADTLYSMQDKLPPPVQCKEELKLLCALMESEIQQETDYTE